MHGFSSGSTFLVNAEVDSMGGVVDGGVAIGCKPSPRRVAIEKAQAELRLEYDVREERRRELEFLEKGGNPLDFKFGHAASVSVQSTSHTYQHPDQIFTSEAKGSFALTASPHGDSVESSGRLGATTTCEPNSADNFDGENEILEIERKSKHPTRVSITPEHSSQLDGRQNVKESEDSPIFNPKRSQAYRRRNRSRPNRDGGPRSSSNDMVSRGGPNSLPGRHALLSKPAVSENQLEVESDGAHALHLSTTLRDSEVSEGKLISSKETQKELKKASLEADDVTDATTTVEPNLVEGNGNIVAADAKDPPCFDIEKKEGIESAAQLDESGKINGEGMSTLDNAHISENIVLTKGLDFGSSCTHTSFSVDGNGNIKSDLYTKKNIECNGTPMEPKLPPGENSISVDEERLYEKLAVNHVESASCIKEDQNFVSHPGNGFADKEKVVNIDGFSSRDKAECLNLEKLVPVEQAATKSDKKHCLIDDSIPTAESSCPESTHSSMEPSHEVNKNDLLVPPSTLNPLTSSESQKMQVDKAHEDRVLEEARIIEAKRNRIAELSVGLMPRESRCKSQWDFVIEEMIWLANDFTQERVWKMTAAAQICHRAAFASRLKMQKRSKCWKQKSVARTLAKAVIDFWHSACSLSESVASSQSEKCNVVLSSGAEESVPTKGAVGGSDKDVASEEKQQSTGQKQDLAVFGYAVRFLKYNCSLPHHVTVDCLELPDVPCDIGSTESLWQDQLTEGNLFYVVPPGAMETYRESIESYMAELERASNNIQEEVDTSMYEPTEEIGYQEDDYEEDEGKHVYILGSLDGERPHKKKRKNMKFNAPRSYEIGVEIGYGRCLEKNGPLLPSKRPAINSNTGSIPIKRVRTAPRQRVTGPIGVGSAGISPMPNRTDASSGDTNSFQDDLSTPRAANAARGSEVDSPLDFDKQSLYDTEFLTKSKKKKKIKNQSSAYSGWQIDPSAHNEQKDHVRKRLDSPLESNGTGVVFAQHSKKPKTLKYTENAFDMPISGPIASPVTSQSNISSQRILKVQVRDRIRKAKALKVPAVQPGSGSPWSSFEDQALIVLVHDMGPNWELVSDAINSTLRFKCIFRKPEECKERHKVLMDQTPGDGADSAEDSGSSQPYPSTLPGIPKGSARQLFQQLQRPMEEDTIKSHFEKIILIGKQLHYRKKQNDIQDLKQIAPVHGSHVAALSLVIPNNLNGVILTPHDLCDIAVSNQDVMPLGFQGPHTGGFTLPNQGASPSMHPQSGLNSSIQGLPGSPSMGLGNNLTSQSSQFANSRYPVPRSTSMPMEEQQRLQQYNHMPPGRNVQPSNLSSGSLSGIDRGVRILPGGNGGGLVAGMSRSMPTSRPGLQGAPSSSMLNSGSMLSSNIGGMSTNMNIHSGTASGQGNPIFRSRDALHMVRHGQNSDHQRQMILPESSSPGVPNFGAISSGFTNQTTSPPLQSYAGHHHQQHPIPQQHSHVLGGPHAHLSGANHSVTPEQQAAYIRIARDRKLQQRLLQRQNQQQQLPSSSALMTHAHTPGQIPVSSVQASSLQSPSSSQPVSLPPLTTPSPITHVSSQSSQQQKHQVSPQGLVRNAQSSGNGLMNQMGKQRQRQVQQLQQQYQQSSRQHPQQRQQSQSGQQAKHSKGMGRNNLVMHQNQPIDPSHLNGVTANPGNQVAEKGEQAVHLMQSQGLYSGSGINIMQPSKSLASPQTSSHLQHQKSYVNTVPATPKQVQQNSLQLDGGNEGQVPVVSASPASSGASQGLPSTAVPPLNHQQLQGHSQPPIKPTSQSQPALQRTVQPKRQVNSDSTAKSQPDTAPVEQQFVNKSNLSAGVAKSCVENTSGLPLSFSASTVASKQAQESPGDSAMTNTSIPSVPISSPTRTSSSCNETLPSVSDSLVQRQFSGNVATHGNGVQFQHQQSQLQRPSPLQPILTQKQSPHQLPQLEKSPQSMSQPQPQSQIQAGQNSVFTRSPNSRLE
ncbi:chromatin modification-related protein EAF1 B-like isoform X2 [Amaranthus tricolor]|uniref:chromatin modification-related protein EAF1 B-like isoform X2 n=1 Tax=Amaranthus tricolor TaxID=29722 RepID=UPI00258691A8|nr:chromatin modification-related protein EAF1 B-like isoform X2 [Amaranthus tricolor]